LDSEDYFKIKSNFPGFSPTPIPALPTKMASTPNRGRFAVTFFHGVRLIGVFKNEEKIQQQTIKH
jgi:hypothetical protein